MHIKTRKLLALCGALILGLGASYASAAPVIIHSTETAVPGDVIGLQGDSFGSAPQVWMLHVTGTEASLVPKVRLTVLSSTTSYVSALIPSTETTGLYAVWVSSDGGSTFGPGVYINMARAWGANDLCGTAVDPGRSFRLFGRNLLLSGTTPKVTFVSGTTSLAATVTTGSSDAYALNVTAPAGLVSGTSYTVWVNNGYGGTYGNNAGVVLTGTTSGTDPFGLGVPWGKDFTFSTNIYNVKSDGRLSIHAVGDGVTNDTAAIQNAINVANSAGGGVVYFPAGTYKVVGPTVNNGIDLIPKANVVFKGDGMTLSTIEISGATQYGFGLRGGGTRLGFVDIGIYNTATGASWSVKIDGLSDRVFALRAKFRADVGKDIVFSPCTRLLVRDSLFVTGTAAEQVWLRGNTDQVFKNNTVSWYFSRIRTGQESVRSLIENNHLTRIAINNGQLWESGGFDVSMSDNTVVLNNTIDRSGSVPLTQNNDGETIMAQCDYNANRDAGAVTGATSITLTDTTKNWTFNYGTVDQFILAGQIYYLTIVNGPGTGQFRKIIANTTNTLTVDRAWDVLPTAASRYVINHQLRHMLVKGNSLSQNPQGIEFYTLSTQDVVFANNTMVDNGGIWFRVRYNSSIVPVVFDTNMDTLVTGNSVTNTLNWYTSAGSYAKIFMELNNVNNGPGFGTNVYGVEFRNNTITAPVPNQLSGISGEGFGAFALMNNGAVFTDNSGVELLGTIFHGNTSINTANAYHLSTGDYSTSIWNALVQNITSPIYDAQGAGTTHASVDTLWGDLTGYWNFDNSTAQDGSGNKNNGTLIGNPTFSTDVPFTSSSNTHSIVFSGTNRVEVANAHVINPVSELTVAFWMKSGTNGYGYGRPMSKTGNSTSSPGWEIQRQNGATTILMRIDTSAGINQTKGALNVCDNIWHYVAYVLNRGTVKAYKDGVLVSTSTYSHGNGFGNDAVPLEFGAGLLGGVNYTGMLDDVQIFNSVLSDSEIAALYNR